MTGWAPQDWERADAEAAARAYDDTEALEDQEPVYVGKHAGKFRTALVPFFKGRHRKHVTQDIKDDNLAMLEAVRMMNRGLL